jgi:hypothetical protein
MLEGVMVPGWNLVLGDSENWNLVATSRTAKSAGGKVAIEPADYQGQGDALKVEWKGKDMDGVLAFNGTAIDLSKFEGSGALVIQLKVNQKPDKDVTLGMDCGYPCSGAVSIGRNLSSLKKNEWAMLPIPLNCFSKEKVDLAKIDAPFKLKTKGKLTITIANIHLAKLTEGDKGCAE